MYRIFLISLLFLLACSKEISEVESNELQTLPQNNSEVSVVEVQTLQKRTFMYHIQTQGKVESLESSKMQFQISGLLQKIYIKNGSLVQKGQIIAQLDNQAQKIALAEAQNEVKLKQIAYQDLVLKYSTNAEQDLKPAIVARFKVTSGLAQAEINLKKARLDLERSVLYAPIRGKVAGLEIQAHNMINPNDIICEIYNHQQLVANVSLLESELNNIAIGQEAKISPLAQNQESYTAKVIDIDPKVDKKGMFQVKIKLNDSSNIISGMHVNCDIQIPQKIALVVPKSAIVLRSGKKVVFSLENKKAKWNYVETGLENENEVEITKGLQEGQEIIITNNLQLDHESPVKIKLNKK